MQVLVVCDDNRNEAWAELLLHAGASTVFVKRISEVRRLDASSLAYGGQMADASDIPNPLPCAIVHGGDSALWNNMNASAEQVFWFNAPGTPHASGKDLPVLRRTAPNFNINKDCAREILAYSAGERDEIPSCCKPKRKAEILPALSILCQGYLAVHADEHGKGEELGSALDQMGWSEDLTPDGSNDRVEEVSDLDWWQVFDGEDHLIEKVEEEWGSETGDLGAVEDLLKRITDADGRIAEEQGTLKEEDRVTVADAYCKLAERLGGEPCP